LSYISIVNIQFCEASVSDIPVLIQHRLDFLEIVSGVQPAEDVERVSANLLQYFPAALADGSFKAVVAKDDAQIVATGGMILYRRPANYNSPNGRVGYILNMYTVPTYRRQGIGYGIMQRLIEIAKEESVDVLELHASSDGESLYRRFGFHVHPVTNMVVKLV